MPDTYYIFLFDPRTGVRSAVMERLVAVTKEAASARCKELDEGAQFLNKAGFKECFGVDADRSLHASKRPKRRAFYAC